MLRPFTIHEPATVEEASALLGTLGEEAVVYAGGTELLLIMNEGLVHYQHLVNVKTIPQLDTITADERRGVLRLGTLCTHAQLERSPVVQELAPLLAEAEGRVANLCVRNVGTLGGNLAFAEPHSDPGTVLAALGATIELTGRRGARRVPVSEFFRGPFETARGHDEILTTVELPTLPPRAAGAYLKFGLHERPAVGVAAIVEVRDGVIRRAAVAVGSVDPVPHRVPEAEEALTERHPSTDVLKEAASVAASGCDPIDDLYGSAAYKRHIVRVLTKRALAQAVARATGGDARGH